MKEFSYSKNRGAESQARSQLFRKVTASIEAKPSVLTLPPEVLGSLEEAIFESRRDGLERSQIIKTNPSSIMVGESTTIGNDAVLQQYRQDLFGIKKPVTVYHTHPSGKWQFSEKDITFIAANPRLAHIHLVGTENGVSAIVPTEQPLYIPLKTPVQIESMRHLKENNYWKAGNQSMMNDDYTEVANVLREQGLIYYVWRPEKKLKPGDLANGLSLTQPDTK